jgi:CRP/FNR family transcriptional regulator, cyclic AMP receptor protein
MLSDEFREVLSPPDLFGLLSPSERQEVERYAVRRRFRVREAIFRQDEPHRGIFIITTGLVRVFYVGPSGREITLGYWSAGHFAGGPEIFGRGTHLWSGEASEPTEALFLAGHRLAGLVRRIPNVAVGIIEGLIFKGRCYSILCRILGTRSASERLGLLLLLLADLHGRPDPRGTRIGRGFTHENMATLVGATRQWVTTTLRRFEQQGLISRTDNALVLHPQFSQAVANLAEGR